MTVKASAVVIAVTAAVMLAISAVPAGAAPGDGQLGGPPGFPADDTLCPAGEAVTGVEGFTRIIGGFIPIVAVATVQCTDGTTGTTMGSGGGTPGATSCPTGQVAVGITGAEGDFIDLLTLLCANADGSGVPTPSSGAFGGGLGVPDGPYLCPTGTVLTGLTGQSVQGETIRFVEIVCGPPPGPPDRDGDGIPDTDPPTDRDQCRDGGWASFNNPAFRNQGQCVSYVSTRVDA